MAKTKSLVWILIFIIAQLTPGGRAAWAAEALTANSTPNSTQPAICSNQLPSAINAVIQRPQFQRVRWGILIETLSSSETLYSRSSSNYFTPASNAKLFTTAAALQHLGPQYRIRTSVYSASTNPNTLRLVGRGDPSLTDAQLRELAQQLKKKSYKQVEQLIVQDGYFSGPEVDPSWEWGDLQEYYAAPVNSLIVNQNAVGLTLSPQAIGRPLQLSWADPLGAIAWQVENNTITSAVGSGALIEVNGVLGKPLVRITGQLPVDAKPNSISLAVINPAESFLRHFLAALVLEQIKVQHAQVVSSSLVGNEQELAAVESPALATMVAETNTNSNNFYAEALLRSLQAKITVPPSTTSTKQNSAEIGLNIVKQVLTELGVDPQGYKLVDGSGLSRHNLVTPEALVQTLKAMAKSSLAEVYRASLPVAGVSGTLKNRFLNTPVQGILQAKTGTMTGVSALSGYLNTDYQPLVFSMIVNQYEQPAVTIRQAMDEIVLLMAHLHRC